MRTDFFFFGLGLGIVLAAPAWAQVESTQQTTNAPNAAPAITQDQQFQPIPSLQDIRSPLTTIMNRQRPATAGPQAGTAEGTGSLAPGARAVFFSTDPQQPMPGVQVQAMQVDLEAQQKELNAV